MADKKCINCGRTYNTTEEFCPRCMTSLNRLGQHEKQEMLEMKQMFDSLKSDPSFSMLFEE